MNSNQYQSHNGRSWKQRNNCNGFNVENQNYDNKSICSQRNNMSSNCQNRWNNRNNNNDRKNNYNYGNNIIPNRNLARYLKKKSQQRANNKQRANNNLTSIQENEHHDYGNTIDFNKYLEGNYNNLPKLASAKFLRPYDIHSTRASDIHSNCKQKIQSICQESICHESPKQNKTRKSINENDDSYLNSTNLKKFNKLNDSQNGLKSYKNDIQNIPHFSWDDQNGNDDQSDDINVDMYFEYDDDNDNENYINSNNNNQYDYNKNNVKQNRNKNNNKYGIDQKTESKNENGYDHNQIEQDEDEDDDMMQKFEKSRRKIEDSVSNYVPSNCRKVVVNDGNNFNDKYGKGSDIKDALDCIQELKIELNKMKVEIKQQESENNLMEKRVKCIKDNLYSVNKKKTKSKKRSFEDAMSNDDYNWNENDVNYHKKRRMKSVQVCG